VTNIDKAIHTDYYILRCERQRVLNLIEKRSI